MIKASGIGNWRVISEKRRTTGKDGGFYSALFDDPDGHSLSGTSMPPSGVETKGHEQPGMLAHRAAAFMGPRLVVLNLAAECFPVVR